MVGGMALPGGGVVIVICCILIGSRLGRCLVFGLFAGGCWRHHFSIVIFLCCRFADTRMTISTAPPELSSHQPASILRRGSDSESPASKTSVGQSLLPRSLVGLYIESPSLEERRPRILAPPSTDKLKIGTPICESSTGRHLPSIRCSASWPGEGISLTISRPVSV